MSKRKLVSKLLYEFAALIDKQKNLEYAENNVKRCKKDYDEASAKVVELENKILSMVDDRD